MVEHRITNRQLSEFLKVGPVTVSRWCTNDTQPSIPMLFRIAHYLNIEVADLLNDVPGTRAGDL
ncbi:MAG: helix-turn-helix transcriptional regulator [Chitinophagaceae bacterium]